MKAILISILILFTQVFGQGYEIPVKKSDNTILYKIENRYNNNISYLFGSIHVMCSDEMQYSNLLNFLVEKTDQVVMEINFNDENNQNIEPPKSNKMKNLFKINSKDVREFSKILEKNYPEFSELFGTDDFVEITNIMFDQDLISFAYILFSIFITCDGPEMFLDYNENGEWDIGEQFTDENGNGEYDNGILTGPEEFVEKLLNTKEIEYAGLETESERNRILSVAFKKMEELFAELEDEENLNYDDLIDMLDEMSTLDEDLKNQLIFYNLNDVKSINLVEKLAEIELNMEWNYSKEEIKIFDRISDILDNSALDERNLLWLPRMKKHIDTKSTLFIVGMDHLEGLVPELRDLGYTLTPLDIGNAEKKGDPLSNGTEFIGTFKNGKIWNGNIIEYYDNDEYMQSKVSSNEVGDIHTIATFLKGRKIRYKKYHEKVLFFDYQYLNNGKVIECYNNRGNLQCLDPK